MNEHDYAGCLAEPCARCHDYEAGYSAGKLKARAEIVAAAAERRHTDDCGCVPCKAVREVLDVAAARDSRTGLEDTMYRKATIRKAPADVKALMRIANGLELDLRALRREIEARRDAQQQSRERLGEILDEATLFHHDDRAETPDGDRADD